MGWRKEQTGRHSSLGVHSSAHILCAVISISRRIHQDCLLSVLEVVPTHFLGEQRWICVELAFSRCSGIVFGDHMRIKMCSCILVLLSLHLCVCLLPFAYSRGSRDQLQTVSHRQPLTICIKASQSKSMEDPVQSLTPREQFSQSPPSHVQ